MRTTTKILVACLPGIVTGALLAASTGERAANQPNASATSKAKEAFGKLPLSFEPNRGQTDPRVQFISRNPGYTVFFTNNGETVLSLKDTATSNAVVRMKFVGGADSPSAHPIDALPGPTNYLIGNDKSKWVTDVPEYTKLRYENVYPGIDVVYLGEQRQLRYDFVVKPGADPHAIQMAFEGQDKMFINKDGDLALSIDGKNLVTRKPFAYQEIAGTRKEVASRFVVNNGKVTFEVAQYDASKELVIDPTVVFITFIGGTLNDAVNAVAIVNPTLTISSLPSAYFLAGTTNSPNFPTTTGVVQATQTGVNDVFVTKISFNGAQILWSTYLGGNSQDSANAVAVDAVTPNCVNAGCPIVVGQTFSANFPTVPTAGSGGPPAFPNLSGTDDAFAAKLGPDGKSLTYSVYIGGVTNDKATGVAVDLQGNVFVGGYTDSPYFLCAGGVIPPVGTNQCTNANHNNPGTSSDAFVVKIPSAFPTGGFSALTSALYGGFGEEDANGLAYNPVNNMVYLAGNTTTAPQNFIAPNNQNLPGITNNTVNQYSVTGTDGKTYSSGLPGPFPSARGGFIVAFDATSFVRTFASYVAVSPSGSTGTEFITGIAAEGGAAATGCSSATGVCTATSTATATIAATYGNIGHVYITGGTTSKTVSANIAAVVVAQPFSCANPLAAASIQATGPITGPNGTPVIVAQGQTTPAGCTTALVTQVPYNFNQATVTGCAYPLVLPLIATATCNLSAFVAILDGALLTNPAPVTLTAPVGNQIEYWAYYSSPNSSTIANAIAIDSNPTTLTSVYSLGTYQQMYITGGTTNTAAATNALPTTDVVAIGAVGGGSASAPSEIFTTYNVGTTGGGGVGGTNPVGPAVLSQTAAFFARFNANGVEAVPYGGQDYTLLFCGSTVCRTGGHDQQNLTHTPQFNYGEFLWSSNGTADGSIANTVGNAIAVDPTRAALVGGSTNEIQLKCPTAGPIPCNFTTTNFLPMVGGNNNGPVGNDGWASVLFFNDILTDASSISTANPFLQPGFPQLTPQTGTTTGCAPGGINDGKCSYIETTPAPYGPTFDFSIADPSTQTQSFQVIFTGQTAGQILNPTPIFVPLDPRSNANPPTVDNNLPGSGIVYWLPCQVPSATGTLVPGGSTPGNYNNAFPAPGSPYGPVTCTYPVNHLYEALPNLYSGWPGPTTGQANSDTLVTPGWLLVSVDTNSVSSAGDVVRLQLDRRAAAGLLEGTYVAQFLVSTYDSQHTTQWPPCGPFSTLNPFQPSGGPNCSNPTTPLPADNASILVTVRLIVRPSLFLSRNAGILTGITSSLGTNPIFGPSTGPGSTTLTHQDGTDRVPDWLFTGTINDISTWPGAGGPPSFGLNNLFGALTNVNAGANVCVAGNAPATTVPTIVNLTVVPAAVVPAGVTVPCPITATNKPPYTGAPNAATAYYGNGPGDGSQPGPGPNINFVYDSGSVLTITPAPLTACVPANPPYPDPTNTTGNPPNACYLGPETNQAPIRTDQLNAPNAPLFNADWQGGVDPVTQRNDATVHDYYTTVEGAATLSIAAINCTGWGLNGVHNTAIGNWLAVQLGNVTASGTPLTSYTPICTDATTTTVGTVKAPATFCKTGCTFTSATGIGDDIPNPPAAGGQQVAIDLLTKAFSGGCVNTNPTPSAATLTTPCTLNAGNVGPRSAMNGIPTGMYTAQVFVWSTRAKNSVPGYCLGASMPASPLGVDPSPLCTPSTTAIASTANPNPEVPVQNVQTFNVSLLVFDTTQTIQITPNTCPTGGVANTITEFANVQQSENDFTGNVDPPAGTGTLPNYPNFGPNSNANSLVAWSLLPFQTTGTNITGCFGPGGTTASGAPCPVNANAPIPLPQNVTVNPETLAAYNSCTIPTGVLAAGITNTCAPGTNVVNGQCIPGVGSLTQVGPLSSTQFQPSGNGTNNLVTIYSCRPTIAPAWINSPLYPGNSLVPPGSPEPYANGNGPFGGPNATPVTGCSAPGDSLLAAYPNCKVGLGPVPSISGLTCPLVGSVTGPPPVSTPTRLGIFRPTGTPTVDTTLEDVTGLNAYAPGTTKFISTFFTPASGITPLATDLAVAGDWTGGGHWSVGVFRPTTGQWFLDVDNDGIYSGTDPTYSYGGLLVGGVAQDVPAVGDWNGTGRSCIGIFRQGFLWVLDTNCNGTQDAADNVFGFGGVSGDVGVTGNWGPTTGANGPTRVGLVRKYAPGGVPQGNPFFWVLDAASATDTNQAHHIPCLAASCGGAPFGFGGVTGDVFITGDWLGTGVFHAGVYRSGNWLEDTTGAHSYDTFFQFGGVPTDQPIPGKW